MSIKLAPSSGMRDFPPDVCRRRRYALDKLEYFFSLYGYLPLQTPAIESLEVLLGQYGDEGDKLVYRILDSGDPLAKLSAQEQQELDQLLPRISSKGLRYDLTVPLARFVARHRHELTLPFKRWQMAPVWRADRPQKGRYREFYQCDVDIVGGSELLYDAELLLLVHQVMHALELPEFRLLLNDRRLLSAIAAQMGIPEREKAVCTILDKRGKVADDAIWEMLQESGLTPARRQQMEWLFSFPEQISISEQLAYLQARIGHQPAASLALADLGELLARLHSFSSSPLSVGLQPTLARGMDYYTSTIFEAVIPGSGVGSVVGGGRYDKLLERFGVPTLPCVGLSFGLDRIYQVLEDRALFPAGANQGSQLLIAPLDSESERAVLPWATELRGLGLATEVYPATSRPQKPLAYADSRAIPWAILLGETERLQHQCVLKDMKLHRQSTLPFVEAKAHLVDYYKLDLIRK